MLVSADRREMVNKVQNDTDILQIEMQLAVLWLYKHEPQHVCVANAAQIVAIDRKWRLGAPASFPLGWYKYGLAEWRLFAGRDE